MFIFPWNLNSQINIFTRKNRENILKWRYPFGRQCVYYHGSSISWSKVIPGDFISWCKVVPGDFIARCRVRLGRVDVGEFDSGSVENPELGVTSCAVLSCHFGYVGIMNARFISVPQFFVQQCVASCKSITILHVFLQRSALLTTERCSSSAAGHHLTLSQLRDASKQ